MHAAAGDSMALSKEKGQGRPKALVIGVGGGSLPVFLAQHLGFDVDSVELDAAVLDLAQKHFGFSNGANLQVCSLWC